MSEAHSEADQNQSQYQSQDQNHSDDRALQPMPVTVFEGAVVSQHEGKIPGIAFDMTDGYARGTHLRLQIDVRVRNVRMEEDKRGELVRQHVFALEEITLIGAYSPDEAARLSAVGGSLGGEAPDARDASVDVRFENHTGDAGSYDPDDEDEWLRGK